MICPICRGPVANLPGIKESEVLCLHHLRFLYQQRRRYRCSLDDCQRPLYAGSNRVCAWCAIGRPVTVNQTTKLVPVKVIRGAEYIALRDLGKNDDSKKM